ncbi:MAG: PAS domain S-box protein [Nitrospinae bacterium]|nr:PAS domain S-box protein [Nitrospinota bacterium]
MNKAPCVDILMIDDSEDDFVLIRDMLAESGARDYSVSWAPNFEEGLALLISTRRDTALLDYRLGSEDGLHLMAKARKAGSKTPIIFLTGMGNDYVDIEAIKCGAADYLVKEELTPALLDRTIRHAMERHRMMEAVAVSEEKFRAIFEDSAIGIAVTDMEGTIHQANTCFQEIFQMEAESLMGRTLSSLAHPEDKEKTGELYSEFRLGGHGCGHVEIRYISGTGSVIWGRLLLSAIREPGGGKAKMAVAMLQDITERKNAEEEIRRLALFPSENPNPLVRFTSSGRVDYINAAAALLKAYEDAELMISSISSILVRVDHEDVVRRWNVVAEKMFGVTAAEAVGRPVLDLRIKWDWEGFLQIVAKCRDSRDAIRHEELQYIRPDGGQGCLGISVSPLLGDSSEWTGYVALGRDITREKEVEEKVKIHQQQLIVADKMASLGIMAAGVAHEISNPNNFIMFNAPLLSSAWKGVSPVLEDYYRENGDFVIHGVNYTEIRDTIPRLLEGVIEGSRRIQAITAKIRDFSQYDENAPWRPVDVNDIARKAVDLTSHFIKGATSNFDMKLGGGLPLVNGNFQELEQVMINLITNACQALPCKERGVSIQTGRDDTEGMVTIKIADEGVGIPPENLKRITDPFFTTKRELGGTGLGLSISFNIISSHAGFMRFDSMPGSGTVVTITLPASNGGSDANG